MIGQAIALTHERKEDKARDRSPLVDRFGRHHTYLRVSLTDRCNFRCVYCMPEFGIAWRDRAEILTFEEITRLVRLFASMGVNKVRLTGGEPTLRKGLTELIGTISKVPGISKLYMTTNGTTLRRSAQDYRDAGLTGLNISIDTLRQDRFKEIARRDSFEQVVEGIDAALAAGYDTIKINVVAMAGVNEDEVVDFVKFAYDKPVDLRFIEFMPFDDNGWTKAQVLPYIKIRGMIEENYELTAINGEPQDVAREFAVSGAKCTVGFISSMTDSFCSGCNRLRLTADGKFKSCLFLKAGDSLRDQMRNGADDDALEATIRTGLIGKWKEHPPMDELIRLKNASMVEIGG